MNHHPYLRAYLAGVFVPTLILPLFLTAFIVLRLVLQLQVPIERGIVFPMALVPILWGLWNVLWLGTRTRTHLAIGPHGAILPCVLLPLGIAAATRFGMLSLGAHEATWFHAVEVPYTLIAPCFVAALAVYYLVWKFIVGFLNQLLGIA